MLSSSTPKTISEVHIIIPILQKRKLGREMTCRDHVQIKNSFNLVCVVLKPVF